MSSEAEGDDVPSPPPGGAAPAAAPPPSLIAPGALAAALGNHSI